MTKKYTSSLPANKHSSYYLPHKVDTSEIDKVLSEAEEDNSSWSFLTGVRKNAVALTNKRPTVMRSFVAPPFDPFLDNVTLLYKDLYTRRNAFIYRPIPGKAHELQTTLIDFFNDLNSKIFLIDHLYRFNESNKDNE